MLAKQLQGAALATIPQYIEDVFSTYLYTGNGSTQTITNGIDLSGKGGMVWVKSRSAAYNGWVFDTQRGANKYIVTNSTSDQGNDPTLNWSFLSNGFSQNNNQNSVNLSGTTYASWTFRKQAKFFDVVTYTGNGTNRTISHNLGSVPGTIIIKRTDTTAAWAVYHRSLANTEYLVLNTTAAKATGATYWNSTTPTSTEFSLGTATEVNASGGSATYVAYLFAHDAGGFGAAGTDNVISCGSFTTDGSANATVTLGYEPQFVIRKRVDSTSSWIIGDVMRGMTDNTGNTVAILQADLSDAEVAGGAAIKPRANGFFVNAATNATYIYIAIRRGPMKTPTSGTSVFTPALGNGATPSFVANFPVDLGIWGDKGAWTGAVEDRLRGSTRLFTNTTAAEATGITVNFDNMTGFASSRSSANIGYSFRRAPGFFDVVCYTGNDVVGRNIEHNLVAVPELIIVKLRTGSTSQDWAVYTAPTGNTKYMRLNDTLAATVGSAWWNNTTPTNTVFTVGNEDVVNNTGWTYVAYLFATVTGVSKVGSYTGTGTTLQVDCGFTAGARFVMIKRTDSTGDWYVWDSARGIVAGNDPYLLLNSTAAEVTNTDYVDTSNAGFEISSTAPAAINANGGTFIFLAIS